jgi:butyrate kinase
MQVLRLGRTMRRSRSIAIDDNSSMRLVAQEAIKRFLHDHQVRAHKGDGWSVTWSTVKGRVTLNKDAVQEAGIDLSPFEQEGNASERLIVT